VLALVGCTTPRPQLPGLETPPDTLEIGEASSEPMTLDTEGWSAPRGAHARPWSESATAPPVGAGARWPRSVETEHHSNIVEFGFRLYSRYITRIDGARCEHRPTCSRYALEAVREHGFVLGAFLSLDRLLRTNRSSTLRRLPSYRHEEGYILYSDPLEENDFFL
jgi:putative component of membrane protein insertase Oxa1/YidC/SpoIIIJ protein YidD